MFDKKKKKGNYHFNFIIDFLREMEVGRKKFVGGNWKSNNTLDATKKLVTDVLNKIKFDPAKVGNHSHRRYSPSAGL